MELNYLVSDLEDMVRDLDQIAGNISMGHETFALEDTHRLRNTIYNLVQLLRTNGVRGELVMMATLPPRDL